jgi:hypothetical protein
MKKKDQLRLGTDLDGSVAGVRRRDGNIVGYGVLMPLREGQPLAPGSEIVRVEEYEEDGWHDIETVYRVSDGPAQVATPAYRAGYDRIFGKKEVGLA